MNIVNYVLCFTHQIEGYINLCMCKCVLKNHFVVNGEPANFSFLARLQTTNIDKVTYYSYLDSNKSHFKIPLKFYGKCRWLCSTRKYNKSLSKYNQHHKTSKFQTPLFNCCS